MQYLCLIYHEEQKLEALSQPEMDKLVGACIGWVEDLETRGRHALSAGLQSSRSATTLRLRDGKVAVSDGPFAETKEHLGGFTLIEARDLNEALQVASSFPAVQTGVASVEVRPVLEADATFRDPLDLKMATAFQHNARSREHPLNEKFASLPKPQP